MLMFAVIGWLLVLALVVMTGVRGFGLIVVERGFTGRFGVASLVGSGLMLVSIIAAIGIIRVAPFHITIG